MNNRAEISNLCRTVVGVNSKREPKDFDILLTGLLKRVEKKL